METKIGTAGGNAKGSLRATIPKNIVKFLNLKIGDWLEWHKLKNRHNNEKAVRIKKVKGEQS